jgi:hypothetical protein
LEYVENYADLPKGTLVYVADRLETGIWGIGITTSAHHYSERVWCSPSGGLRLSGRGGGLNLPVPILHREKVYLVRPEEYELLLILSGIPPSFLLRPEEETRLAKLRLRVQAVREGKGDLPPNDSGSRDTM